MEEAQRIAQAETDGIQVEKSLASLALRPGPDMEPLQVGNAQELRQ